MNRKCFSILTMVMSLILAAACLGTAVKNNNQSMMAIPMQLSFSGQYSYDGENWHTYTEDSDISSYNGDIRVKLSPNDEIFEGAILNIYSNHIGISMYVNDELVYMDTPTEIKTYGIDLMPSMCGKLWKQVMCPGITTDDVLEFRFTNYHKHGNMNAYKEALSQIYLTPMDSRILEIHLKPYTQPIERVGFTVVIVAAMLLGAAVSVSVLNNSPYKRMFKFGLVTLFAGGYIIFDVMLLELLDELLLVKTYGKQLCMMFTVLFLGLLALDHLSGKRKSIANLFVGIEGLVDVVVLLVVLSGKLLIFDTQYYWARAQVIICPVLIILSMLELLKNKKAGKIDNITTSCLLFAILLDIYGVADNIYCPGICAKTVFLFAMIVYLGRGAIQIVSGYNATIKNKKLEEELESSRIAIMISQIQPHFLYNSLTSIMALCDENPKQAKAAIADFADYLRGNLASLRAKNLISIETEINHVERYLRLEKLRFKEALDIEYDINSKDFMVPALAIQPLVENAVKHGLGRKVGGGKVIIHTSETDTDYIVRITDNGVGFEEGEYADDGCAHIGLDNIRKRLDMIMGARLDIQSEKGKGTVASVIIPKRRD